MDTSGTLEWQQIRMPVNDPPHAPFPAIDVRCAHRVDGGHAIHDGAAVLQSDGVGEVAAGTRGKEFVLKSSGAREAESLLSELGLEVRPARPGNMRAEQRHRTPVGPQGKAG